MAMEDIDGSGFLEKMKKRKSKKKVRVKEEVKQDKNFLDKFKGKKKFRIGQK